MKKAYSFFWLFVFVILVLGSCKKKNGDTPPDPNSEPVYCYERVYEDAIPVPGPNFILKQFTEDKEYNIVFVWETYEYGNDFEGYNLTKLDTGLNKLWTKYYSQIEGFPTNLFHDNFNNYYLITADKKDSYFSSSGHYFANVSWQSGFLSDSCAVAFDLYNDTLETYVDNSYCYIYKFNSEGNLLWTTKVDKWSDWSDNNVAVSSEGEIIAATYTKLGRADQMVWRDGIFQDTIRLIDSTYIHLYKLSQDGATVWSRSIEVPTHYLNNWYLDGNLSIGVTISENLIYVMACSGIYTFNMQGELIDEQVIPGGFCRHTYQKSSNMINGKMHVICRYYEVTLYASYVQYVANYFTDGSLDWIEEAGWGWNPKLYTTVDGGYIIWSNGILSKSDANGILIWRTELHAIDQIIVKPNCIGGATLMYYDYPDLENLIIRRIDENGNY